MTDIRTPPATDKYRDNYDRIFNKRLFHTEGTLLSHVKFKKPLNINSKDSCEIKIEYPVSVMGERYKTAQKEKNRRMKNMMESLSVRPMDEVNQVIDLNSNSKNTKRRKHGKNQRKIK